MAGQEQVSYGRAGRMRVAVAAEAREVADSARWLVGTYADSGAKSGELAGQAARVVGQARALLTYTVAYERMRGVSWEVIGEALGVTRQTAHERFAADVEQLQAELVKCWLLGEEAWRPRLPEGAADPAGTAHLLDRWAIRHQQDTDPPAHEAFPDTARSHPVSHGLPPLDALEHSTLITIAARMVHQARTEYGPGDPQVRRLEIGFARRKVQLYERMLAEETAQRGHTGTEADKLADLLAGARARLADLDAAGSDHG